MSPAKKAGGSRKSAAARRNAGLRNQQRAERNRERLAEDLEQYASGGNIPQYIPIRKTYQSPLRGRNNKIVGYKTKKRITGYRNARTGEVVTPKYHADLGRAFTTSAGGLAYQPRTESQFTVAELARAEEYTEVLKTRRRRARTRSMSLVESYQIKQASEGNPMSKKQVRNDPNFIDLTDRLETFTAAQRRFTADNWEQEIRGTPLDIGPTVDRKGIIARQARELREAVGEDPEYQQILVDLGRRLPEDTRPVGSYRSGELKTVIQPFYEQFENYPGELGAVY